MKEEDNNGESLSSVGDVREWCLHQLESAIKKLTERVNVIAYTRNPEALAATARQCDELESVLTACEFQLQYHKTAEQDYSESLSSLLLLEAHQLLADAQSLVHAPLQPDYQDGNVVALKPSYADLTDAAFERLLASSVIPQFLSTPAHWHDEQPDIAAPIKMKERTLKLVYSKSRDC